MNRRGFLGSVAALVVAPRVLPKLDVRYVHSPSLYEFVDKGGTVWGTSRTMYPFADALKEVYNRDFFEAVEKAAIKELR